MMPVNTHTPLRALLMNQWQLYAVASAFFAGLTAIFAKVGVSDINSNFATFIRTLVIMAITAAIVTLRGEWESPGVLNKKSLTFLILSGVATGLSWLCYYRALQLGPASKVAPVDKLSVVFVIIIAFIFLGEPLSWQVVVGGFLIAAGSLVLALA